MDHGGGLDSGDGEALVVGQVVTDGIAGVDMPAPDEVGEAFGEIGHGILRRWVVVRPAAPGHHGRSPVAALPLWRRPARRWRLL